MPSNSFGHLFRMTSWGESHGKAIGVLIDGCPAGLELNEAHIQQALDKRAPGNSLHTSPRKEPDQAEILSGVFDGVTTGAPIMIQIQNKDIDSSKYEPIKDLLRPGHANYTYLEKYGVFDWRGGGRSSARETAARVAAGAVAGQLLRKFSIEVKAYLSQVGTIISTDWDLLMETVEKAQAEGDSIGGVVEFVAQNIPIGLGDPIYDKLEANLAKAMLSLPATKGFEIGEGFAAAAMKGSDHNDTYQENGGNISLSSNRSGGTLGGISTGKPLVGRVAFKPTSSIKLPQKTVSSNGRPALLELPKGSRHDPCVAIRAVPVVEAMVNLVLADAILRNRSAKIWN